MPLKLNEQIVEQGMVQGAQQPNTRSHACSSATNAVRNACVSHQVPMATNRSALATKIGGPREVAPSALK